jgi:uncharacterized protein
MAFPANDDTGGMVGRHGPPAWLRTWRLPLLLVPMLVVMAVMQELTVVMDGLGVLDLVMGLLASAATLFVYVRLSKYIENRPAVAELPRERARSGLLWGSAIGAAAFLTTISIIWIFGGLHVAGPSEYWKFLATIGIMACAAVTEEVVFRGVVLRILEERFGTWPALAVSALLFGAVHAAGSSQVSGGAELWGAFAITLQAGILLGAAYVATGALWLPIGIHFAWNLVEAGIGTAVSGKSSEFGALAQSTLLGPSTLTGGSFGPEAGVAAISTCLVAGGLFLWFASRSGRIVHRRALAPEPMPADVERPGIRL